MKKDQQYLLLLALLRFVLPFFLQHSFYQPHRDEYLYLDYAGHMDWGYMEVPPLLSVFSWISALLGSHIWVVKLWPALFGSLTFWLCGDLVLRHNGGRPALLILFVSLFFGAFIRVFFLFQPGFLEVFCWTAITYCLVRFQQQNTLQWLYGFGIMCGLGMLSKYTTAFFLSGLVLALLLSPLRKIFFNRHFYLAGTLGFLIFLPNLLWQYQHNFPIVSHMKELRETQLVYLGASDFLMGQLGMNFVVILSWVTGLLALLWGQTFKPYRWIGICYFFVIALLMAGNAKEYYALGVYPVLFAFGSTRLAMLSKNWHAGIRVLALAIPVMAGLFILPLGLPVFKPGKLAGYYEKTGIRNALGFKWEDQENHPLPQDFADMVGWREIAEMTAKHYLKLPDSIKTNTVIFCRGYYTAGALNYFGRNLGLPRAISDNGSYLTWIPEQLNFRHLFLVGHHNPGPDDVVFNHFKRRLLLDSVSIPLFRENGIKVFFFENGSDSMLYYARKGIRQEKARFTKP